MASLSQHYAYPTRFANKEPQWATVYDDLFNQYVDTDGLEFGTCNAAAISSSDEASNNDIINSIEANSTDSGDSSASEAAARRLSDDFWARTLAVLEESASTLEEEQSNTHKEQQREGHHQIHTISPATSFYNTKNHPHADFLSLGGFPSPHISTTVPSSPSVEAAARRRKAQRYQQDRSTKTPERPVGISKSYRSSSKSPKMMSPSHYRAGAQDAWMESIYHTPSRMTTMNLPVRSMPLTPPSSGRHKPVVGLGFQGFGNLDASPLQPFTNYDEKTPPFTSVLPPNSLPRQLYSPETSPLTSPSVERGAIFTEEPNPTFRDVYYAHPSVDTYNKLAWSANSFGAEDIYEPSPTFNPWMTSEKKEADYQASLATNFQVHENIIPTGFNDPTLAPTYGDEMAGVAEIDATLYYTTSSHSTNETNMTRRESRTPSPMGRTKRNPSSKTQSRKCSSEHGKSSNRASKAGGFVNYTPSDSDKLLSGVAPSGSSKTKARREREQAERWRRFSHAAAKAVAEANGVVGGEAQAPVANMMPVFNQGDLIDTLSGGNW